MASRQQATHVVGAQNANESAPMTPWTSSASRAASARTFCSIVSRAEALVGLGQVEADGAGLEAEVKERVAATPEALQDVIATTGATVEISSSRCPFASRRARMWERNG